MFGFWRLTEPGSFITAAGEHNLATTKKRDFAIRCNIVRLLRIMAF